MKLKYSQRCHRHPDTQVSSKLNQAWYKTFFSWKASRQKPMLTLWHIQEFSTRHKTCAMTSEQVKFLTLYLQGRCARVLPAYGIAVVGPYYLVDSIAFHRQRLFWWHHSQFFELEFDIHINTRLEDKNNSQYQSLIKKMGTLAKHLMVKFYAIWKRKSVC